MEDFFNRFLDLIENETLVNLIGGGGTGKSSLAQFLIGKMLLRDISSCCAWIQASEPLAVSRLKSFFKDPSILARFFAFPKYTINSLSQQVNLLTSIINETIILPPRTKYIVIDNISHHLRSKLLKSRETKNKIIFQNKFFNQSFFPLYMFAQRQGFKLILIHEVSYNPRINKEVAFFHGLYDNIEALNVHLVKDIFSRKRLLLIKCRDQKIDLECEISDSNFNFKALNK